jgi:hypothetical protein
MRVISFKFMVLLSALIVVCQGRPIITGSDQKNGQKVLSLEQPSGNARVSYAGMEKYDFVSFRASDH